MKRLLIWFLSLSMLGTLAAIALAVYAAYWFTAPGPLREKTIVEIPPGTAFTAITRQLVEQNAIDNELLFKMNILWNGSHTKFKAGEYYIDSGMSPRKIMDVLVNGEAITHSITIPEGWQLSQISAALMKEDMLEGAIPEDVKEGTLMPDTYFFHRHDSRASVIQRMKQAMNETVHALWNKRAPDLPLATPMQAVILASIVEKETGVADERAHVAGVFINRLRRGMPLQSDPTVVYGIELNNGPMQRPLMKNDLLSNHPYNTYIINGLPQGAIANPGRASLEATLNPLKTDDLYFVATGDGGHHFAKTLQEHNQNVARYRQTLREATPQKLPKP